MVNDKVLENLEAKPLVWSKGGFRFIFRDIFFEITLDRSCKNEATYAIHMMVYSKVYAKFLDNLADIKNVAPSCPRLRRIPGTSDIAVFGQASWEILKPGWNAPLNEPYVLDEEIYTNGRRFVRIGCSVALEESLRSFTLNTVRILERDEGLLSGYMPDGFISLSMGSFDPFYGFIFACRNARKTAIECKEFLLQSGISEQYPESFKINSVTHEDINKIYTMFPEQ